MEPYWGKPAVRNLRGDDGNVGIIRSPVRAIVLPDQEGVLDVRDLKLGEIAHLEGIFASRSHGDPGRACDRGLYNGARHAYLSKRKMK